MEKKPISHFQAGLLIAAILILFSVLIYLMKIDQTGIVAFIPFIIIIAGLILFIKQYGDARNNQVGFGGLFSYGFKTTAILTLIVILFTVIFVLLFPDIKEKAFETARLSMEKKGNLTGSEIDEAVEMVRKMFWVYTIGGVLLIYTIVGCIGSLIGAAVTKKKPISTSDQL